MTRSVAHTVDQQTELWEEHRDRVYRYLLRLTGEPDTAEDLTQETFLQAFRDLGRSHTAATNTHAWVMRLATNRAMDLFRRRRLIKWIPFLPDHHGGVAEDSAESLAQRDLVAAALRKLAPDAAAILLLRDAEGFSGPEIAAMLDLEQAAVRKRLSRAREAFRTEYLRLKGDAP